jgi:hypothetical protein
VTGCRDDLEVEHPIAVPDGSQRPRHADRGDVLGAGIADRIGRPLQDGDRAARVVGVVMRQDEVTDCRPAEANRAE